MSEPFDTVDINASGAIQAYVPAPVTRVVCCSSCARPKSEISRLLADRLLQSILCSSRTSEGKIQIKTRRALHHFKHIFML